MKHVKQFESVSVKKRYAKYYDFLTKKYGANHIMFGDSGNNLILVFKYQDTISKENFDKLYKDFSRFDYQVGYDHRAVRLDVNNVPYEILDEFDFEMDAKRYNL